MNGSRPGILVIDGDRAMRHLVLSILDEAGLSVDAAADGKTALARIARFPVDLAIVDLGLSGALDGIETVRRARMRKPDLKALFMSSGGGRKLYPDLARDDLIHKPFASREFLGCVFELLLRDGADLAGTPHDRDYHLEAELVLAEARRGCLRQRRVVALRSGNRRLAAELARDLAEPNVAPLRAG